MPRKVIKCESIRSACGHDSTLPHYENDKPEHLVGRRNRILTRDCRECRLKKNTWKDEIKKFPPKRLPDGTLLQARFNLTNKRWTAMLLYPEGKIEVHDTGLFWCITKLIKQYGIIHNQPEYQRNECRANSDFPV